MKNKPLQIKTSYVTFDLKYNYAAVGEVWDMCYLIVSDVWPFDLSLKFLSKFPKYSIV